MEDNLAALDVRKVDPTDKVAVLSILAIFFLLAALTSSLPSPDPLGQADDPSALVAGDAAWVLTASAMVLIMTPGVSFFYGGMVDHKNIISTMYQRYDPRYHCMSLKLAVPFLWEQNPFVVSLSISYNQISQFCHHGHC